MFWPMRSQRQLPHHTPRALFRLPLMPLSHGQRVFLSTVFCLHIQHPTFSPNRLVSSAFHATAASLRRVLGPWMFWLMQSQRQLLQHMLRTLSRQPRTLLLHRQRMFLSTVFCLHTECNTRIRCLTDGMHLYHGIRLLCQEGQSQGTTPRSCAADDSAFSMRRMFTMPCSCHVIDATKRQRIHKSRS